MPYGRPKLKPEDIDALAEWVRAGAPWPASSAAPAPAPTATRRPITADQRAFWAFQPLAKTPPPAVRDAAWARNDIDRFVLARLEHDGLHAGRARRQAHADPARDARSDRAAADA